MACVPHVPLITMQDRAVNAGLWGEYQKRIEEFRRFDPQLVVVFGGDHYDGLHLKLMPQFVVGQVAEALDDCGGFPGRLNVPRDIALKCAEYLTDAGFDIATSYAMEVDHGFSNVMHAFMGTLDAYPVLPIHINSLCHPRPTFKRCRQLGEAIGKFAGDLGLRVAFLGSGGLSHQTDFIFPQYDTAPDERTRAFIVHGGAKGELSRRQWMADVQKGMSHLSAQLVDGSFTAPWINKDWDQGFLEVFSSGELSTFDGWTDHDVIQAAGYGGGEVRQWIAAAAAAGSAGASAPVIDYYSSKDKIAVGAAIAHAVGADT
jgi:2,3-dihydroxyphenylpropionate 1,2-dioxygenase